VDVSLLLRSALVATEQLVDEARHRLSRSRSRLH
jgi:hypothetical protein